MRRLKLGTILAGIAALSLVLLGGTAMAGYPDKPVTFIVNYGAGGTTDLTSRLLCSVAEKPLGQTITVVNKPGGGGTVGPTYLATRKPNGYTIGVTSFSPMAVAPHMMKVSYTLKDFAFIAGVCRYLYGVAVAANSPYKTWADLMKAIESGKRLTMATPSPVQAILFPRLAKFTGKKMDNVVWVRYKSGKETTVALLGGHVDLIVGNPMDIAPQVKTGELRMLASCSPVRWPLLPDVPTLHELGYKVDIDSWLGFAAPAGIKEDRRAKLQNAFKVAVEDKHIQKKMIDLGMAPMFMSGAEYNQFCEKGFVEMGADLKTVGLEKKK
ncbi:MAG: tripartite tricarboxylate transporter substrate binding protein [Proteobacteria bacterium]|nr:tripartite tricarboxylate transporter substrate binding protein [Pseudomonadota bacterium]MBU4275844.1 tripartite tricarboxylate transporter substrate binding protein [Pseudomonadota bacterium]MBU4383879.1 tripartite tricarboxylate transporter substrate binding protein [Pseudomonadota bacterium]MBU4605560.1 tripartite tricarboxylate transporter substrate binding protein [Pseudomonadota bacterium]MCG2763521.1 tripartite tricarboxylate transporter substrate binding protein [Desulfarculaceae ba